MDVLKSLDIADAGFGESFHGLFDAPSDAFIEGHHIFQRRLSPFDLPHSRPSLSIASACGMPLPQFFPIHTRASETPLFSSSVSGSSSSGALRKAVDQLMGEFAGVGHRGVPPESAAENRRPAALTVLRRTMLSITERMTFFSSGSRRLAASN